MIDTVLSVGTPAGLPSSPRFDLLLIAATVLALLSIRAVGLRLSVVSVAMALAGAALWAQWADAWGVAVPLAVAFFLLVTLRATVGRIRDQRSP